MSLSALEIGTLVFGAVGAVCASNAAVKLVARNGGTACDQAAAGCVAAGLSAAVLPAAAVGGIYCTMIKAGEVYDRRKEITASARTKTDEAMASMRSRFGNKAEVA